MHSTCRWKLPRRASREKLSTASAPAFLAGGVDGNESQSAQAKEQKSGAAGGGVVEVLHLIVKNNGKRARGAGNVAAKHEDDAEFADGVEKTENHSGKKGAARKRKENAGDQTDRACAEKARGVDERCVDGGEACDERLHGKWKAVDDGADDEAIEGECERMAEQGGNAAAKGCSRAEQDKKKEAEDGGRQDHGQRGESFNGGEPAAAAEHDERCERHSDGEKNRCSDGGETKREGECLPVHCAHLTGVRPDLASWD